MTESTKINLAHGLIQHLDDITDILAMLFPDNRNQQHAAGRILLALKEAGDILIPIKKGEFSKTKIHAELGEIILGLKSGSTHDNQITLFKSVGVAFEDLVTAKLAFNKALQLGIGMKCDLE